MQSQDIHFNDWLRIIIGEVPYSYFIELLIRSIFVYLILMISMRLMGKRMSSQLGRNEMAALVSLAAAVGIPMMSPDRGILPAAIIAFVLITSERLLTRQACKSEKFESYAQGQVSTLVNDGVIDIKEMAKVRLSQDRVLAQLRWQGVLQLGTVSRFYMEAGGNFTLVSNPQPTAGLSVLPPWDDELRNCFQEHPDCCICVQCGLPQNDAGLPYLKCPNCGAEKWVIAVTEIAV